MNKADRRRFWKFVDVSRRDDCWTWRGYRNKTNYGEFKLDGKKVLSHRIAFQLCSSEPVAPGGFVCHSCDNPSCVNPRHLWLGDNESNMKDMADKGRARVSLGEKNPRAKLSDRDVRWIRKAASTDLWSLGMIAERFGIRKPQASKIANRKSWSHV